MDSRVTKVQASSASDGPLGERRTAPPRERWPQPKGDLKAGRRCWEVRLRYSARRAARVPCWLKSSRSHAALLRQKAQVRIATQRSLMADFT